uniref:Transmembrane protein 107 n=1 Tax=Plectus sambesii TaxID=2011161 RepID=A0A914V6R7_9BILA
MASSSLGLVSARFLSLAAHFIITISIFWAREDNVKAGLGLDFTTQEYDDKDTSLIVALSLTLACMLVEIVGFFGGVTTFMQTISLLSMCLHSVACITLAFFVWDIWDCDLYWVLFAIFSALPAAVETVAIVGFVGFSKLC